MLLDGDWCEDGGGLTLKVGNIFTGRIYPRGGDGIYARRWIVLLNGQHVTETADKAYAQGMIERMILDELRRIVPAFGKIKRRAPPAEAIWGTDGWSRWKRSSAG